MKMILRILFLSLSNADVKFAQLKRLILKTYITIEALSITSWVKLINQREFTKAALDKNSKTFVVHVAALEIPTAMPVHFSKIFQVQGLDKPTLTALRSDKAPTKISAKYAYYTDVFSSDLAMKLPKNTGMNEHTIQPIDGKQLPYEPIYAFSSLKLKTLKTYIKTHLKTGFIRPSKSPLGALILFDKKLNDSLCLYINYWDLNNLTIKNRYLLTLISQSLDWLSWTKRFIRLDLTNAYHQMRIWKGDK